MPINSLPHPQLIRSTKTAIPSRPPGLLRRPRLLNYLHENIHRKLFLIAAAAGYGKTSLLVDFAHDTDLPVAWYALDESDRDLTNLVSGLIAALRHPFPKFGKTTSVLLAEMDTPEHGAEQLALSLAMEIESRLDDYFLLILDDYHTVETSTPVEHFFGKLLSALPEQAHLLVASRTIPPFPIISLVARQEIAGAGEDQLRFMPAEVQALLQLRNGIAVPAAEAESLTTHTEGWVTGILLTAQLMWQNLLATWLRAQQASEPVYDYLANEVLAGLPDDRRQFLLEASILPEMEPGMCDATLGRTDSGELLRWAEAQRLFVTGVGDHARTFRYHHLFREFLLKQLRRVAPDRLRELQCRAGEWYSAQGWPEAAITFYLAAGEIARAVAVAEAHAEAMFYAGRHDTLRGWGEQLAPAAHELPTLHFYLAVVHTDGSDYPAAVKALDVAEAGYAHRANAHGELSVTVQRSLVLYRQGKYQEAICMAQQAAAQAEARDCAFEAGKAWRYIGVSQLALSDLSAAEVSLQKSVKLFEHAKHEYSLAWALHDLSRVYRVVGQTAQCAHAQRQALAIWRERGNVGPVAAALNNIGLDQHMLGQYEAALATYGEALDHARRAGLALVEVSILAGRGDLLADLGDLRQADELYHRALQLAESAHEIGLIRYLYLAFARLERRLGNLVGALEWLRRAELVPVAAQVESAGINAHCLRGVLLLEMGNTQEAQAVLSEACAALEAAGARADLAHGLFCLARARFRAGDTAGAFADLQRAFALTQAIGYDQMLVSEAPSACDLLDAAQQAPDIGPRAASLLARAQAARGVLARVQDAPADSPSKATIELQALGGSRVLREGIEIPRGDAISLQRPREVLFFVADRAPVDRDTILETFWPQMSPARATPSFRQTLYRVRRALGGEAIVYQDDRYRLASSPNLTVAYDVPEFERRAYQALALPAGDLRRISALEAALGRYTGEYLADLPVDWAQGRRRALSDLFVELLRAYADDLTTLARYADARQALARALDVEPLRDDLHERMLACLGALGRRHEVVEHYQRYRTLLRTDLGLDPPPSARELYARLIQ